MGWERLGCVPFMGDSVGDMVGSRATGMMRAPVVAPVPVERGLCEKRNVSERVGVRRRQRMHEQGCESVCERCTTRVRVLGLRRSIKHI